MVALWTLLLCWLDGKRISGQLVAIMRTGHAWGWNYGVKLAKVMIEKSRGRE